MRDSWGDRAFSIVFHSPVKKTKSTGAGESWSKRIMQSDFIEERVVVREPTLSVQERDMLKYHQNY